MDSVYDRIPKNRENSPKHRKICWFEKKLTIFVNLGYNNAGKAKRKRKPPPNASFLRYEKLLQLGWQWVPKNSVVDVPPPVVLNEVEIATQDEVEIPLKQTIIARNVLKPESMKITDPDDSKLSSDEVVPTDERINARVQIYWQESMIYVTGKVAAINNSKSKSVKIKYDNGEEAWVYPQQVVPILPEYDKDDFDGCEFCMKRCELKKCTACKSVSYCSRSCQKADWSAHKGECKKKI
jgi:hypothetical protein